MIIPDDHLLDPFRKSGPCELCGKNCTVREPHHIRTRGATGGAVNLRINVIACGSSTLTKYGTRYPLCPCHRLAQEKKIPPAHVLAIVARREGCTPEDITEVMDWMQRLIRPTESQLIEALTELSEGALIVAVRELRATGRLK